MKITDKLTTDYTLMHVNVHTDKGTEHYAVEIERPDMDENIYWVGILDLDNLEKILYSHFKINSDYGVLNGYELDEREYLILKFIANRLELD